MKEKKTIFIENCVAKNNIEHSKRPLFKTPGISGGEKKMQCTFYKNLVQDKQFLSTSDLMAW